MRFDPNRPNPLVCFLCPTCSHKFQAKPDRVEDKPEQEWHPFAYFARCPMCTGDAEQAWYQINGWKGALAATGPKTVEGIARVTENIKGHPTPEEALITRFNAMTHGMDARVARYFPAKPGKYDRCEDCEYLLASCGDVFKGCQKKAELTLRHQIAFSTRDPGALMDLHADRTAALAGIVDDMTLTLIQDGVRLKAPKMYYDKDGRCHVYEYIDSATGDKITIDEYTAHPLIKPLFDAIGKLKLSMEDMGMTPKGQDDTEILKGHLAKDAESQQAITDFMEQQQQALEQLADLIHDSEKETAQDEILLEFQLEDKGRG